MALGELEQALGLAVALGLGHAPAVQLLFVERPALLVPDDEHGAAVEPAEPADDRGVVGPQPVALELLEAVDEVPDVVTRARPVLVPRDLYRDPGVMPPALVLKALQPRLQPLDLFRQMDAGHKRQAP